MILVYQRRFYLQDERVCVLLTQLKRRLAKMVSECRALDHAVKGITNHRNLYHLYSSVLVFHLPINKCGRTAFAIEGPRVERPNNGCTYSDQDHRQVNGMYS
ncbi:hypothetical protein CY34DRAFT_352521 [Suillus luteus UH-Slu-Lm8-n1]|uniref:Uncharacterized protein n=1 Tax=Suillus luteus UH-Slu-Lm8-n1 TaxID=930992 RepID=A0A0D0BUV4_9AGAM|nr:hypothetical protein CY34DRAFT_352521 [Suillus luteus UH-Slu-Lm8-n1]